MNNISESFVKSCVLLKASYDVFVDFPSNGYKISYAVMFAIKHHLDHPDSASKQAHPSSPF